MGQSKIVLGIISNRNTPLYSEIDEFFKKEYDEACKIFGRTNLNDVHIFRNRNGKKPLNDRTHYYWEKACLAARCTEVKDMRVKPKYHFHDLRKAGVKYLRIRKKFDREMIRLLYTGHKSKEIFDKIYDAITAEDFEVWKKIALAS